MQILYYLINQTNNYKRNLVIYIKNISIDYDILLTSCFPDYLVEVLTCIQKVYFQYTSNFTLNASN